MNVSDDVNRARRSGADVNVARTGRDLEIGGAGDGEIFFELVHRNWQRRRREEERTDRRTASTAGIRFIVFLARNAEVPRALRARVTIWQALLQYDLVFFLQAREHFGLRAVGDSDLHRHLFLAFFRLRRRASSTEAFLSRS